MSIGRLEAWWEGRKYLNDPSTGGLIRDKEGRILNQEVWHDPNIDDHTNFNVILDGGATAVLCSMFALAGSTVFIGMAAGSGSTAADHTQTTLAYELLGTRKILTNTDSTTLSSPKAVSITTFTDTSYTPSYVYYTQFQGQSTWNGGSDLNAPYQEFAIVSTLSAPALPTQASGKYLDRYVFATATTLDSSTTLVVTATLRLV